jgi:2-amino-4-hydroxy-6-hydroxymethyldihydropteridine diphosphokinase
MGHTVYLALGSNLGRREANLKEAREALPPKVRVLNVSPIYETPPWGYLDQPDFLNQVLEGDTGLTPKEVLVYLKQIEAQMGREKTVQNGPRVIDLDLLFYDDLILEDPSGDYPLILPHPRMAGRAFVLVPLADLAPNLVHPVYGKKVWEMLAETEPEGIHPYPES